MAIINRRFTKDCSATITEAFEVARAAGSLAIEAEHLLLALARRPGTGAHELLAQAGLGERALRAALAEQDVQALAAVGIDAGAFDLDTATPSRSHPKMGTSAKLALERGVKRSALRNDPRILPAHLLLGILQPAVGTVPRMVAAAGGDRVELTARAEASLDAAAAA